MDVILLVAEEFDKLNDEIRELKLKLIVCENEIKRLKVLYEPESNKVSRTE